MQNPHCYRCGGRQRELPRCRWVAAGPGRASKRRAKQRQQPSPTGVEGAGGTGGHGRASRRRAWPRCRWAVVGPGRGAGGWRQGQGGPRDRPLRAAGSRVAISRAGRPHRHTQRPGPPAPGTPVGQQATQEPLHGIAKGVGISRPLERVPSLIHEGHLDATHQRGDDVVEHGAQR